MIGVTTREQSERLLNAGLDEKTCDLWLHPDYEDGHIDDSRRCRVENIPIWSMGALWQILCDNNIYYYEYSSGEPIERVIESLVRALVYALKQGRIKPQ